MLFKIRKIFKFIFENNSIHYRYSRINILKNEFASSFKDSNEVVLCPVYSAGEKNKHNYNQENFSNLIYNKSKIQVINVGNKIELKNYLKKNLLENEIIIAMGAGSISNWIREISRELK